MITHKKVLLCIDILIRHLQLFGANDAYILLHVTMYLKQLLRSKDYYFRKHLNNIYKSKSTAAAFK